MKVLLVEDDKSFSQFMVVLLNARGYEVVSCTDAMSAWNACQEEDFSLIFLDWILPGMSGLELCRKIRGLPWGEGAEILMITARDENKGLNEVLDAGADDYLTKPVAVGLLEVRLEIAESRIRGKTARREADEALRRQTRRLEIAGKIASVVGSTLDPARLFQSIVQEIHSAVPCHRCLVGTVDVENNTYVSWYAESEIDVEGRDREIAPDEWKGEGVYDTCRLLNIPDLLDGGWNEHARLARGGVRSLLIVPIVQDDSCIAHLALSSTEPGAFTSEHEELLDAIAGHLSSAIRNATLYEEAERNRNFFQSAVGDSSDPVIIVDRDRRIIYWNKGAEALYGYRADEVEGKIGDFVVPPSEHEDLDKTVHDLFDDGKAVTFDTDRTHKDGSHIPVSITLSPIIGENGKVIAVTGLHKDLTERIQQEENLLRLTEELKEKNEDLKVLFNIASHDLRSPLVNIQGFGNEMKTLTKEVRSILSGEEVPGALKEKIHSYLDEDFPEALGFVVDSSKKMEKLLAGLLRFSKLGNHAVKIVQLDMNAMLKDIIGLADFQIKDSGAELEVEPLPACLGDEIQIQQVFANLVGNALKYLDPQRKGHITVSGVRENGKSVYCVRDNGIGIEGSCLERIFEIFYRLDHSSEDGDGLGLTLVRRILKNNDGEVRVESRLGEGSAFFVSLPEG